MLVDSRIDGLKDFIFETHNLAFDYINKVRNSNEEFLLYGAGKACYWYLMFFESHGLKPKAVIDKKSQNREIFGVQIISLEDAKKKYLHTDIVISTPRYLEEVCSELRDNGFVNIYAFEAEIYQTFIKDIVEYKKYLFDNWDRVLFLYDDLADSLSKDTLVAFIKGRVSGDLHFFKNAFQPDQYYPKDLLHFSDCEIMVECGSNDGATLKEFVNIVNNEYRKIYLFEPDLKCISQLRKMDVLNSGRVELIERGVWDKRTTLSFVEDPDYGASHVVDGTFGGVEKAASIEVDTIDNCITGEVTFIKMDIEGAELRALIGGETAIKNNSPKLAICIYHNPSDFLDIYEYLKGTVPEYKFYLRHHNWSATETVLYAFVE